MVVLRKEPEIWNQQFSAFNPILATNVTSFPASPHFRGPDPSCPCSPIVSSLCLCFAVCLSGADEAVPPHICRLATVQAAFQTQSYMQILQTTQPLKTEHIFRAKPPQNPTISSAGERQWMSGGLLLSV